MSDSLPILYIKVQSLVLQENAKAMHKACAAFIASKNDERIKEHYFSMSGQFLK